MDHYFYTPSLLLTNDVPYAIERNASKRKNMEVLLALDTLLSVPYEHYFMSCNLDHVLYDEPNMNPDDKDPKAIEFSKQYEDSAADFPGFLQRECVLGTPDDMKKSWEFIKQGTHSLERHTNLQIYFEQHPIL